MDPFELLAELDNEDRVRVHLEKQAKVQGAKAQAEARGEVNDSTDEEILLPPPSLAARISQTTHVAGGC
jgi:hypothetical protein